MKANRKELNILKLMRTTVQVFHDWILWDPLFPETKRMAQCWTRCSLGRPRYKLFTIIQSRHDECIGHQLKVILAHTLPQSANRSSRQHSLFAYFIDVMLKINLPLSWLTPRLQTRSDGWTLALSQVKKSPIIGFLMKQDQSWMTSVLLGLHTNLLLVIHSTTSLIHFWRVLRAAHYSERSIVTNNRKSSD